MEAIAVPANEEHLILDVLGGTVVQQVNLVRKPLPLTLLASDLECSVALVSAIDQSEVRANLPVQYQYSGQLGRQATMELGALQSRTSSD